MTGIGDTCIYMDFRSKLVGRFHWQRVLCDGLSQFQDKCECGMGHPSDLGADEVVWVSPQIGEESDENVGAAGKREEGSQALRLVRREKEFLDILVDEDMDE